MTDARIHERGYRRYDGPRLGQLHAVRSLTVHTLQRILGLRRPGRAKVLPVLTILIAYLPAAVILGIRAIIPQIQRELLPRYEDYYGFISAAILLLVAFTAPESICGDRRSKSLSLYLAAPLSRTTYIAAKWLAVALALLLVTVGPPLVLMVGLVLQGVGPDGPTGVALTTGRILLSGASLAVIFASVSTAVATLTERRAIASAMTLFGITALSTLDGALTQGLGWDPAWGLVSPVRTAFELVPRLYGVGPGPFEPDVGGLAVVALAWAAWTAATAGFAWWRYQRLQVTR